MILLFIVFITHDRFGSLSILFGYFIGVVSGIINNPFNKEEGEQE